MNITLQMLNNYYFVLNIFVEDVLNTTIENKKTNMQNEIDYRVKLVMTQLQVAENVHKNRLKTELNINAFT